METKERRPLPRWFFLPTDIAKVPTDLEIYESLIAIAEHRLDKPGLADLFRRAANSAS